MENRILSVPRHQYQRWRQQLNNNQRSTVSAPQTVTYRSVYQLPSELLFEILSYLTDQQHTLREASLISRKWFWCTIPLLYKHVKISNTYHWAIYIRAIGRDKQIFPYGSLTQSIDLTSCRILVEDSESGDQQPTPTATATATAAQITTLPTSDNDTDPATHLTGVAQRDLPSTSATDNILIQCPVLVSTSSLIQLAHACHHLVSLNLSGTTVFQDFQVVETGEYVSSLQYSAIQSELTHTAIDLKTAIQTVGRQCTHLQQLKLKDCLWVTAHVIWIWVCSCPNLTYLDARLTKCSISRLTTEVLQVQPPPTQQLHHEEVQPSPLSSSSTAEPPHHTSPKSQNIIEIVIPTSNDHSSPIQPQPADALTTILEGTTNALATLELSHSHSNQPSHPPSGSSTQAPTITLDMQNGNTPNRNVAPMDLIQDLGSEESILPLFVQHRLQYLNTTVTGTPPTATTDTPLDDNSSDHQPSTMNQHNDAIALWNQPLCEFVWSVLKEAKKAGNVELLWLQD